MYFIFIKILIFFRYLQYILLIKLVQRRYIYSEFSTKHFLSMFEINNTQNIPIRINDKDKKRKIK